MKQAIHHVTNSEASLQFWWHFNVFTAWENSSYSCLHFLSRVNWPKETHYPIASQSWFLFMEQWYTSNTYAIFLNLAALVGVDWIIDSVYYILVIWFPFLTWFFKFILRICARTCFLNSLRCHLFSSATLSLATGKEFGEVLGILLFLKITIFPAAKASSAFTKL